MRKGSFYLLSLVAIATFLSISCEVEPEKVTLIIAGGASGQDLDLTVEGTQRFMEDHPDVRVGVRPIPRFPTERLELYQELFSEESGDVDVFQIDVVWTGILADHAIDMRNHVSQEDIDGHFKSMIENNTVSGKLVAMPWFADVPSLYFRTDLLEEYGYEAPPPTWEDLEEMARTISEGERSKGNLGFWGYAFQGADYEGLTCNALEWQVGQGGGNFINQEGAVNFSNPSAVTAFERAASWIGTISPREVLNYTEEDTRLIWERGDVAFLRNWPYIYSTTQGTQLKDHFGVAPLPAGPAGSAATLGGWQLMVSQYSRYPEEAAELVRYLTSAREQKIRAMEGSRNPTIQSLYMDPEILEAAPFFSDFERIYHDLITRPSTQLGEGYDEVSAIYSGAVHEILSGSEADEALEEATEAAQAIVD